ncbi:hypothetical protein LOK49_LG02G03083 [Camellia lanceoleosa]|uniref:Uncharacterized protein n=2 Tax=Camellia lanceoleosa TaxID=1840588 RepID=A0ACC0IQL5_9ERIC|nr:hypothetical protein LOK49_LG02G03062 [Camellia lanceoleosa]KAI8027721.1 hypothetical protein LOK49_LG02G03083 [Camellia lanceoleosa]
MSALLAIDNISSPFSALVNLSVESLIASSIRPAYSFSSNSLLSALNPIKTNVCGFPKEFSGTGRPVLVLPRKIILRVSVFTLGHAGEGLPYQCCRRHDTCCGVVAFGGGVVTVGGCDFFSAGLVLPPLKLEKNIQ